MINRLTGVYMPPLTMPQVLKMLPVESAVSLQVLNMASVDIKNNNLAKTTDAIYQPHLHNHYPLLINEG